LHLGPGLGLCEKAGGTADAERGQRRERDVFLKQHGYMKKILTAEDAEYAEKLEKPTILASLCALGVLGGKFSRDIGYFFAFAMNALITMALGCMPTGIRVSSEYSVGSSFRGVRFWITVTSPDSVSRTSR